MNSEEKTILVYRDDEANHKKYEQYDLWPAKSPPPASRLKQSKPISFQNILSKAAIAVVGKQMGLIVEFDITVKEDRLSIELTDVTLEQALKIILEEKKLQAGSWKIKLSSFSPILRRTAKNMNNTNSGH